MVGTVGYRLSHFGLCVSDLERSLHFYCDGLGFEKGGTYPEIGTPENRAFGALGLPDDAVIDWISQFVIKGPLNLELFGYRSPRPYGSASASRAQIGFTHLGFYVDDLEEAATRLESCGGKVLTRSRFSMGVEGLFVADPDGVQIELLEGEPEHVDDRGNIFH
jgi:lactoylglutathione lyase